jgi:hypothetical protein
MANVRVEENMLEPDFSLAEFLSGKAKGYGHFPILNEHGGFLRSRIEGRVVLDLSIGGITTAVITEDYPFRILLLDPTILDKIRNDLAEFESDHEVTIEIRPPRVSLFKKAKKIGKEK